MVDLGNIAPRFIGLVVAARAVAAHRKTIIEAVRQGHGTPEQRIVVARGAERFLQAIAAGKIVDEDTARARKAICMACPSRVRAAVEEGGEINDWCGRPRDDRSGGVCCGGKERPIEERTCGCLVALKVLVSTEKCPQGKWPPEEEGTGERQEDEDTRVDEQPVPHGSARTSNGGETEAARRPHTNGEQR